ncbi:MAG TPA: DUF4911 domain-containing protein [Desulfobacteraceae bacterium]|nr:DUF4911 domain-containing protein [Desulfobacteraceae bacterium]
MISQKKYYRVNRREISFIKFIIEAYEGIAILTTIDPERGIIVLLVPSGCDEDVDMVINNLKQQIMIEDFKYSKAPDQDVS